MRTYLSNFFAEYSFKEEDAAFLLGEYDKITKNPEANAAWDEALALYAADFNTDYKLIVELADKAAEVTGINEYTAELLVYICMSKHLKELYIEKGLPLEYYAKSVIDLRYKMEECKLIYGFPGTFVVFWFHGFFNLTRFGMGRMQFELISFDANYEKNGITLTPESKVINVHIPRSGEPLTEELCLEAYHMAKEFFASEVSDPCPFVCHSHLLYPEQEKFLPKHTNTYKFFKSFDIFDSSVDKSRDSLWRLFDTQEKHLDKLPADTSMRRAYIEHMKAGGKIGVGRGVLFI